jgi:hypothetical protein
VTTSAGRSGLVPTRRGARLLHDGHVVSEILAAPGPTHSLFDVLAAAAVVVAGGPRLALLGFGGGSTVAALRALGWDHPLDAVDLSETGTRAFRSLAAGWAGRLNVATDEASAWLRRQRRPFDVIIEDLSVPIPGDLVMPAVCADPLPRLIAARLRPSSGVAIINCFSPGPRGWRSLLARLLAPGWSARVLLLDDFDHRLLVVGRRLLPSRAFAHRLRRVLERLGSRQARRVHVRAFAPGRRRSG